jgi:hypothetical protein
MKNKKKRVSVDLDTTVDEIMNDIRQNFGGQPQSSIFIDALIYFKKSLSNEKDDVPERYKIYYKKFP